MRLSQVLSDRSVLFGLECLDKWQAIEKLTDVMVESGQADSAWRDSIVRGLVEREKLSSTGMQDGFAIPHCKMDDPVESPLVSLGIVRGGMDFDAIDGKATQLVVCLVTPRRQKQEHLRILASIAQLFAGAEFRGRLLEADGPEEVLGVIQQEEERLICKQTSRAKTRLHRFA